MIQVIHVLIHNSFIYKPNYTPETRATLNDWLTKDIQRNYTYQDGILSFHQSLKNSITVDKSIGKIIIVQDVVNKTETVVSLPKNKNSFDEGFYQIKFHDEEIPSLHFQLGEYLNMEIPSPSRESHKLALLHIGKTIRHRTNFKFECRGDSLGAQRSYGEYDTLVTYLGSTKNVDFNLKKSTVLPIQISKEINERKMLY
ncbi:hypothetical protein [Flammeovirga sp. SubArs3]|uniref:hypothetical protein n=1 Tax=Flammeovirga sp. SubArs3 TaxID=2995316 RepID=UPI00248BD19B|nr:hypothetical protein [Flammeovirga sp. SubArs3]